jgi:hypothetical protein
MAQFVGWFNETAPDGSSAARLDGLARAAIAHLSCESIHPFEDGNGRIGRALIDMAVAQHLSMPVRLFSLSRQLLEHRSDYYDQLNLCQRGGMDVTRWVQWFVRQCAAAYASASATIDNAVVKRRFAEHHGIAGLPDRQRKVLQRLLDDGDGGFMGGLNAEKYMKMTGSLQGHGDAGSGRDGQARAALDHGCRQGLALSRQCAGADPWRRAGRARGRAVTLNCIDKREYVARGREVDRGYREVLSRDVSAQGSQVDTVRRVTPDCDLRLRCRLLAAGHDQKVGAPRGLRRYESMRTPLL